MFGYAENARIFKLKFPILTSKALEVTVLVSLYQTTLNNVAAKTENRRDME